MSPVDVVKFEQLSGQMAALDLEFQDITGLPSLFNPFSVFNQFSPTWLKEQGLTMIQGLERSYGRRAREIVTEFNDLLRVTWNV